MSAPNAGRQSPEPSQQTGAQLQEPTAKNPNDQGAAPSEDYAGDASKEQLKGLESNPKGPLEDEAALKTSKA